MRSILSISLPEKLSKSLDELSKVSGRSKSDIIRESLSLYIWEMKFKYLKKNLDHLLRKLVL